MKASFTLLTQWLYRSGISSGMTAQTMLFFIMSITAAAIAIGSDNTLLMQVMPAILWLVLLLASLLGLNDLLTPDYNQGTLDDMVLSPHSLPKLMALKLLAHFMASGLPLSLIAPAVLYVMDGASTYNPAFVFIGLFLGALYFAAIGLLAASLTLGARRNIALYATIVLPLAIPGLIFGTGGLAAIPLGLDNRPAFYLLSALTIAFITLSPFAAALIIRMKVKS